MRKWFAKVIDTNKTNEPAESTETAAAPAAPVPYPAEAVPKARRLIHAPVLQGDERAATDRQIRIKAQLIPVDERIVLMVDRPLLKGHSFWSTRRADAGRHSPLAGAFYELESVQSVLIHEMNVTVTGITANEANARTLAQILRHHLEAGQAVVTEAFLAALPSEEAVRTGLQEVIDDQINPGIAAHSGTITLTAVKGNTAYIKMGGGCQGCAASSITLRQGVEQAFRNAVPYLGALLDETDHAAGSNPFFTDLPAGMGA